ncbi:MAG TPA: hypothetical protein VK542_05945 [Gemmatimonadaceae bacterium]|nr:hypothetical protein [Gemmatimonadaceae bacterium]
MSALILQSGCRGWIEKPIVPDSGIAIPRREALRVTKSDGKVIFLSDSFITSDSIIGLLSAIPHRRTAIALADVKKIQKRVDNTPRGVRIAGKIYLGVVGVAEAALIVTALMYGIASSRQ